MDITPEIQAAIDAAVEAATTGLKSKNTELLAEVKKLRKGQEIDPQVVTDLEEKLDQAHAKLAEQTKAAKDALKVSETLKAQLEQESGFTKNLLIDKGLTEELVKHGVAPQFLAATKALFAGQAQIIADGDTRVAKIGDKSVSDFVKDWAASDEGKHFVTAPQNSGGGATGGKGGNTGNKTITRSEFDNLSHVERRDFATAGGQVTD